MKCPMGAHLLHLMFLFGAYLGTTNQILFKENDNVLLINRVKSVLVPINWNTKFWRIFISSILILMLSQPYIAELAFKQAEKIFVEGEFGKALPFYELARRFAPYNPHYFVKEGTYWRWIVLHKKNDEKAAFKANKLFLDGAKSNPFDVKNVLSRAILHRDYPHLLINPANEETILGWFDHVLFWQPRLVTGQFEYVSTLYRFGHIKRAMSKLDEYIILNPKENVLLDLKKRLSLESY